MVQNFWIPFIYEEAFGLLADITQLTALLVLVGMENELFSSYVN
jgi:hypothetical protein